jgi:hypothetical protein
MKKMNEYDGLDSGRDGTNPDYLEALALIRTIYWPKHNKKGHLAYFVTQDEIEYATRRVISKYSIETIKKFFAHMKENELIGSRGEWTLSAVEDDLDTFLGKKTKPKPIENKITISDMEQSNRYMHLIYARNVINVDVLKEKPIEKISVLTTCMANKYGHKAIEILMDYCIWHRLIPKKGAWTHLTVEQDINTAIQWSIQKPEEYLQRTN